MSEMSWRDFKIEDMMFILLTGIVNLIDRFRTRLSLEVGSSTVQSEPFGRLGEQLAAR